MGIKKDIDLREDKLFFIEHPGDVLISTAKGEELRELIGAAADIECSSKAQQNVYTAIIPLNVAILPPRNKVIQCSLKTQQNIVNLRPENKVILLPNVGRYPARNKVILPPRKKMNINGLALEASNCLFNVCHYSCDL